MTDTCRIISSDDYTVDEILFDAKFSDEVDVDPVHLRRWKNRERAREARRLDRQHLQYWKGKVHDLTQLLATESRKRQRGQAVADLARQEMELALATNSLLKRHIEQNRAWLAALLVQGDSPHKTPRRVVHDQLKVYISLR